MIYRQTDSYTMTHVFDVKRRERLWDEDRRSRQPIDTLMAELQPVEGEHWIDLGAGNGYVTVPLLERGCKVTAVDLEQEMIFDLISRVPDGLEEKLETAIGLMPPVPVEDNEADAAVLVNTLHEISDKRGLVKELSRVLSEKGRVHVIDHHKDHGENGPPRQDRLSPDEVISLFEGFRLQRRSDIGVFYHMVFTH